MELSNTMRKIKKKWIKLNHTEAFYKNFMFPKVTGNGRDLKLKSQNMIIRLFSDSKIVPCFKQY